MKVILFGATGMVGQGVLRECLLDSAVQKVLSIGRSPTGLQHEKLNEIELTNLFDLSPFKTQLKEFDACFFCLGVSSAGMTEENYRRVTYDLTLAAALMLVPLNPAMTFIYVSGQGTDTSERGTIMWARVKGKTENALLRLPFKAAFMFRPGIIQPLHGVTSKTKLYRFFYVLFSPIIPLLKKMFPNHLTTTEQMGRAMIRLSKEGGSKKILETKDINDL